MTITEIAKSKLKNVDVSDDEIQIALDEVEQVILNYCNIYEVPEALNYTWANMAVDLIRFQFATNNSDSGLGGGTDEDGVPIGMSISSISVGDTTTSFKSASKTDISNNSKALGSHIPALDGLVMNYTPQLQKFRKVVW